MLAGNFGWLLPAGSPDQTRIAILDDQPGPNDVFGSPVIAILDPNGILPTVTIPAGNDELTEDVARDWTLTWQRLALP